MTITFEAFIIALTTHPVLKITTLLIMGVILVNGWTDAPNAIASIVATGEMKLKDAVRMAAVCNFAGLFVMSLVNTKVAFTIYNIADFGTGREEALAALCAALTAIILWSAAAWCFGIPTSESHALVAGISGAAIALHHGLDGIHMQEWVKVLYGLCISVIFGLGFGWIAGKLAKNGKYSKRTSLKKKIMHQNTAINTKFIIKPETPTNSKLTIKPETPTKPKPTIKPETPSTHHSTFTPQHLQRLAAAAMAFMHGAQDGQKFIGVFLLGICLAQGKLPAHHFAIPIWMMLLCSLIMALGTMMGGERIINTVGKNMVQLDKPQGIAADIAGVLCLLLASLWGIPVSTTHVKTTSIMGVGLAENAAGINKGIVKDMFLAWIITFPCCGIIGYLAAGIFMYLIRTP